MKCQYNETWSLTSDSLSSRSSECDCKLNQNQEKLISNQISFLLGYNCVDPPTPDPQYKLKLLWNPLYPPTHNETVIYICDAGSSYNRLESDFNKWNFSLTCLQNNIFSDEPNVPWPTCVDSEYQSYVIDKCLLLPLSVATCPNPTDLSTDEIILTNPINNDLEYTDAFRYKIC